jgi:chromosome segregation ATPase
MPEVDPQKLAMEIGKLIGDRCALEMAIVERNLANRVEAFRTEMMTEVREVKSEIRDIKETQSHQAVSIAEINTRLAEGERRFQALEDRVARLEQRERAATIGMAKLAGVATAGSGLGALGMHILHKLVQ